MGSENSYEIKPASFTRRPDSLRRLLVIAIFVSALYTDTTDALDTATSTEAQQTKLIVSPMTTLKTKGIIVPKRSGLIIGLNEQFTRRRGISNRSSPTNTNTTTPTPTTTSQKSSSSSSAASGLLAMTHLSNWINGNSKSTESSGQKVRRRGSESLYVDKQKQELFVANPDLHNEFSILDIEQRSSASSSSSSDNLNELPSSATVQRLMTAGETSSGGASQLLPGSNSGAQQQPSGQLFRGHSLIELEVKSESDKRYVQDLYGNLSTALNEQAQRPQSLTVSPYVDIDFWSFKCAVNDHIDIMVSPKSRAFILNQLNRANIKHRIKVNDIQTRIDQQQPPPNSSAHLATSNGASQPTPPAAFQFGAIAVNTRAADIEAASLAEPRGLPMNHLASSTQELTSSRVLSGRHSPASSQSIGQRSSSSVAAVSNSQNESSTSGRSDVSMNDTAFFDNYQRLSDINMYLESITARARDIARVQVIGRSSQGRYLRVLKLGYDQTDIDGSTSGDHLIDLDAREDVSKNTIETGSRTANGASSKSSNASGNSYATGGQNASYILENFLKRQQSVQKLGSIWLDGGTHAREWISPATVLYIAFRLAENNARCMKFVDSMRLLVSAAQNQNREQNLEARNTLSRTSSSPTSNELNVDLEDGDRGEKIVIENAPNFTKAYQIINNYIDKINNNDQDDILTAKFLVNKDRARSYRSDAEHRLELLAKRPQEVASEHGCDLELEQLLRRYTFYVMPVLNPDGYEYSHTHNRLWRKTRSTSSHPIYRHFCLGADPNRNYDARHGSTGSSAHPCSQTYSGTVPFTEPETKHQSNFVYAHRQQLKMYISFHSYSQMILLPFSHSKQLAPDHKDLESVGQAAVRAIEQTHGTVYRVGPSASILYTASGTASDWAYEKAGIKYSYTIELRDTGSYGFLLPKQQIVPTGEETFNGLLAMIGQMEKNDNLLTSKSHSVSTGNEQKGSYGQRPQAPNATVPNGPFLHAPDSESLLRKQPSRPFLENVLDHSHGWSSSVLPSVRDRPQPASDTDRNTAAALAQQSGFRLDDDETIATANADEPDAGYAFEGEGELMEPTAMDADGNARALVQTVIRMNRRQSHQLNAPALKLTANGRNSINGPPLPSKMKAAVPRRELSQQHRSAGEPSA